MATVLIENLKSIQRLEFQIPTRGVHVLTGVNGSGKTSLLTCLERLANPYAFQRHFKTSSTAQFDNFQSSSITYSNNGTSVQYIYRNTRWAPNPRANARLLSSLGFNEVIYLTSSDDRFYVQSQELNTRFISGAPTFFKDGMNEIFQTNKYDDLRRVKLTGRGRGDGRWNYGFILPAGNARGQNIYYTEKNFSLGEILILNALFQLNGVANDSLVLIDEMELALHPKVQIRFMEFLERIEQTKQLTIIISTHSSPLIRSANKLIHLHRDAMGIVSVDYDCFPAIALQNVAVEEDIQPDFVFFVEDAVAKNLLEELLEYYFRNLYGGRRPVIKVLPVGGWRETIKLCISANGYLVAGNTNCISFLDFDAQTTIQGIQADANRSEADQDILNQYNRHHARIKFLPVTPELGIVDHLNNNVNAHIGPLQQLFNCPVDISRIIREEVNRGLIHSPNLRKAAKAKLDYYLSRLQQASAKDPNVVRLMLTSYYASSYGAANRGLLSGMFNPIFN